MTRPVGERGPGEETRDEIVPVEPIADAGGARSRTLAERDARFGQLLLAPTLLVVLVVVVLPILWTVVLAFQDLRLIDLRRRGLFGAFTLDNFRQLFSEPAFLDPLLTTFILATSSAFFCCLVAAPMGWLIIYSLFGLSDALAD